MQENGAELSYGGNEQNKDSQESIPTASGENSDDEAAKDQAKAATGVLTKAGKLPHKKGSRPS